MPRIAVSIKAESRYCASGMTVQNRSEYSLSAYEITADRKTLYADLKDLEIFGIVVEGEPVGKGYHYHVVERPFQLAELKLLVDAIQSSKFITVKKTRKLIGKLEQMVSRYEASELQRQVFVAKRIKTIFSVECEKGDGSAPWWGLVSGQSLGAFLG